MNMSYKLKLYLTLVACYIFGVLIGTLVYWILIRKIDPLPFIIGLIPVIFLIRNKIKQRIKKQQ